jgi:hypothetical protein
MNGFTKREEEELQERRSPEEQKAAHHIKKQKGRRAEERKARRRIISWKSKNGRMARRIAINGIGKWGWKSRIKRTSQGKKKLNLKLSWSEGSE